MTAPRCTYICGSCLQISTIFPPRSRDQNVRSVIRYGKKLYECQTCGKLLLSRTGYRCHMNTHEGRGKLACQYCDKTFQTRSHLEGHENKHTNSKPYICGKCSKGFGYRQARLRHERACRGYKSVAASLTAGLENMTEQRECLESEMSMPSESCPEKSSAASKPTLDVEKPVNVIQKHMPSITYSPSHALAKNPMNISKKSMSGFAQEASKGSSEITASTASTSQGAIAAQHKPSVSTHTVMPVEQPRMPQGLITIVPTTTASSSVGVKEEAAQSPRH